tara:strand:- start:61 stop:573 length:513 start_codon:yes stop_codon:yes gene_type:complete
VRFIEENKDKPFCLFITHGAFHSPVQGPTDSITRGPKKAKGKEKSTRSDKEKYTDMLVELDRSVGAVVQALKDNGLDENTLVLFTSDNGPMKLSTAVVLRGKKGSIYEGGHRVPTVAWWPGKIKPSVCDTTAIGIDIMPTVFSLTKTSIPDGYIFDGVDLTSLLLENKLK